MTTEISSNASPLRVRFTRKPVDLQEVLAATPYDERPEPVVISARLNRPSSTFLRAPPLMLSGNQSILPPVCSRA